MPRTARPLLTAVALAVIGTLGTAACASSTTEPGATRGSDTGSAVASRSAGSTSGATAAPSARAATSVSKMLVFVVENHSLDQMRRGMPYVARLASRYGYTTRYHAITHPSLPNYLAIAGGDTFGVSDDASPAAHPLRGHSVFGAAIRGGSTAALYADSMTSRCQQDAAGRYAVKHNPWAYFTDERQLCRHHDLPLRRFGPDVDAGALPAVGMVIPNLCHDGHDCSLKVADAWLRKRVNRVLAGPDWASGKLAVVITADEDDTAHGNRILTVVAHPSLDHRVVRAALSHYSLSRSLADVAGVKPLRNAAGARSLLARFGLSAG